MFALTDQQKGAFAAAVRSTAARPDVRPAIDAIHEMLADAIDLRQPRCDQSGRCCRFESFGHRLFITTLEMAAFADQISQKALLPAAAGRGGCPFQIVNTCGVHAIRPFGCRVFFCDPSAEQWQQTQYEQIHRLIRLTHERLGVPYYYVEWREGLAAVGLTQPALAAAVIDQVQL